MVDEATETARTALDQPERDSVWSRKRPRIGLGAAAVLAVTASAATALYLRRRAQARVDRMTWLAMRASALGGAIPGGRRVAPFGGAGGALLLLAATLLARSRRAPEPGPLDELSHRVAQLQARAEAQALLDRPRGRDLLIGAAMGLGLAGLIGRRPLSRGGD